MISNNPLMNFARKAELSVKLPSNCNWYEDGMIEYTPNGEVEVYPMLPKDELMMVNPDALLSGQSNINLIRSCVPSIKEPEKLLYPDANVLFLAIQKATYGNTIKIEARCPKCQEKQNELSTPEKIAEAESKGELTTHSQTMEYDIDGFLQTIDFLDKEYVVNLDNGLDVYVHPTYIIDKAKYGLMLFNQEKIIKNYKDYDFEKSMEDDKYKEVMKVINDTYAKINDIGNHLITNSILKIKLPDQTFVTDPNMIYEFIINTESKYIMKLNETIRKINDIGLTQDITYRCECCGYEWTDKFFGYNQSDFFGISSYI